MTTIGYGDVAPVKGFGWVVAGTAVYTLTVSVIADWFYQLVLGGVWARLPSKNKEILVIGDNDSCHEII